MEEGEESKIEEEFDKNMGERGGRGSGRSIKHT